MNSKLLEYMARTYSRDVMKDHSVVVETPDVEIAEVEAAIKGIDELGLGAHLANRDFVSYQNRRALVALLEELKEKEHGQIAP